MAFNINEFRGKLQRGGARNNLFEVLIPAPANIVTGLNVEQLSFMCKASSLPASRIGQIAAPYFGRTVNLGGDREFDPWSITIINDETFDLRNAMELWQSSIASYETADDAQRINGASANPNSYVSSGFVKQYGKDGTVVKEVKLINIFPTEIGAIELAWDSNNQIEEFEVIFALDYITSSSQI
jgi:hypothetical protein